MWLCSSCWNYPGASISYVFLLYGLTYEYHGLMRIHSPPAGTGDTMVPLVPSAYCTRSTSVSKTKAYHIVLSRVIQGWVAHMCHPSLYCLQCADQPTLRNGMFHEPNARSKERLTLVGFSGRVFCFFGLPAGWLAGWLAGLLACWLAGWLLAG